MYCIVCILFNFLFQDVWAYTAVQIPVSRIFTINPKGELRHALTQAYRAS